MTLDAEPAERDLHDHVALYRRRWSIILVVVVITTAAALFFSLMQQERYRATAEVLFPQEPLTSNDIVPDQQIEQARLDPERVISDEIKLIASKSMRDDVIDEVGRPVAITAAAAQDTDLIKISATSTDPDRAAEVANIAAEVYIAGHDRKAATRAQAALEAVRFRFDEADNPEERQALAQKLVVAEVDAILVNQDGPKVVSPATAPSSPYQPTTARNVVLGLIVGLALGFGLAYLVDHLDDRVRSLDRLGDAVGGLPVLDLTQGDDEAGADRVRVAAADDAAVAQASADLPLGDVVTAGGPSGVPRVLLVPVGSKRREVRQACRLLDGMDLDVAAACLVRRSP